MENTVIKSLLDLLDTQMEAMGYLNSQLGAAIPEPAYFLISDVIDGQLVLARQLSAYNQSSADFKYIEQSATVVSNRLIVLCGQAQADADPSEIAEIVRQLICDLSSLKETLVKLVLN
jgi:hypothetical protein